MLKNGIIIPNITVFDRQEYLDVNATMDHVDWLIANGADAIVPCGSSGELPSLSFDETIAIMLTVLGRVKQVPIYPAIGRYSTRDTVKLAHMAEDYKASGVMVSMPYVMLPDRNSIMEHFRTIRKETKLPIILYNNPWMYGVELSCQDIAQLVEEGVVNGVKASQGDPFKTQELKYLVGDKALVYYGHDYAALEALAVGADGWFSAILNVFPKAAQFLYNSFHNSFCPTTIWRMSFMPFVYHVMNKRVNGSPHPLATYKAALNILGRKVGEPRKPILPLTIDQYKELEVVMKSLRD